MRFSTFLSTEWEFLHAVFTTTLSFLNKTENENPQLPKASKTLRALEVLNIHSGIPETVQNQDFSIRDHYDDVTNSFKSKFWYCGVCPKLTAAWKRQIHHYLALSQ